MKAMLAPTLRLSAPWAIACLSIALGISWLRAQDVPPPTPDQEQPQIQTRGPVHEAFAEPINYQFDQGDVAPSAPPPDIDEVPPEYRPEGDQYVWVPGYWALDPDQKTYMWVSGCWRAAPPKMSWTPGYWSESTRGWEWVAGYWGPEDAQEVEYLPAPPAPDNLEPPGAPPTVDDVWVPPCPYWTDGRYVQRAGYWLHSQPGWMWVASHYEWTPRGYVFCPGHWDYPLDDRGVLFAPVEIPPADYQRRGYVYTPSIVVDTNVLASNLFVSVGFSHYFFGDYYGQNAVQVGIVPWFDHGHSRSWYDPMYEYDRSVAHVSITEWDQRQRHDYDLRRNDQNLRPPRTYRELETRIAAAPADRRQNIRVVQSLTTVVNNNTTVNNTTINNNRTTVNNNRETVNNNNTSKIKFEKIDNTARQQVAKQAAEDKKVVEQRKGREGPGKAAAPAAEARGRASTPQPAGRQAEPQLSSQRQTPTDQTAKPAPSPAERGRAPAANESAQPEVRTPPAPERGREPANIPAPQETRPAPAPSDRGDRSPANTATLQEARPTPPPAPAERGRASDNAATPQEARPTPPVPDGRGNRGDGARGDGVRGDGAHPAAEPAPAAPDRGRGASAQREVRVAQPERESIPNAPAARGRATPAKAPPPAPADEAKRGDDSKNTPDKPQPKPQEQPATRPARGR